MLQLSSELDDMTVEEMVAHFGLENTAKTESADLADAVEEICTEIVHNNPDAASKIVAGRHLSINYLVGQAMRATQGKVDSRLFEETFRKLLLGS